MSSGHHTVRIEFVDISGMLMRNEDLKPFYDLVEAAKARVKEAGSGEFDFYDLAYGGIIQFSCVNADACYASLAELLASSPLSDGARAELIYGDEDDADSKQIPIGATA